MYKGHCSHVTNVRWTKGDDLLLSTGGMDATLLVWERVSIDRNEEGRVFFPDALLSLSQTIEGYFK